MAGALPNGIRTSDLKSRVLNLAQTSVFQVKLNPPPQVVGLINTRGFNFNADSPNVELLCESVDLPGTSLQTFQSDNNYAGVTEDIVDRREYGRRLRMSFYVDRNYKVFDMFDGWIDYISNQIRTDGYRSEFASYRMNYPVTYRGQVYITKFEKEGYGTSNMYTLIGAYPISINQVPLSYGNSQIMQYTVTFAYLRYVRDKFTWKQADPSNSLLSNFSTLSAEVRAAFNSGNPNLRQALEIDENGNTKPGTAN